MIALCTIIGRMAYFIVRCLLFGIYTIDQSQRAVKTRFGRAIRVPGGKTTLDDPIAEFLRPEERTRLIPPVGSDATYKTSPLVFPASIRFARTHASPISSVAWES